MLAMTRAPDEGVGVLNAGVLLGCLPASLEAAGEKYCEAGVCCERGVEVLLGAEAPGVVGPPAFVGRRVVF